MVLGSSTSALLSTGAFALVARCRAIAGVRLEESVGTMLVDFGVLWVDRVSDASGCGVFFDLPDF